jgi:hypothetical protein
MVDNALNRRPDGYNSLMIPENRVQAFGYVMPMRMQGKNSQGILRKERYRAIRNHWTGYQRTDKRQDTK